VNTSAYTGNSPTNFTDPSGEFVWLIPMAVGCVSDAVFSIGGELIGAKLTGQKLDVGGMLRNAAIACVAGAFMGVLGEFAGAVLGRILGNVAADAISSGGGRVVASFTDTGAPGLRLVIGRMADLTADDALGPGEYTLLARTTPNLGSAKLNWLRNAGELRKELSNGVRVIRDASPNDFRGQFLNAERNLLRNRGWTFDRSTNLWHAP
jgi:hypothetical protein